MHLIPQGNLILEVQAVPLLGKRAELIVGGPSNRGQVDPVRGVEDIEGWDGGRLSGKGAIDAFKSIIVHSDEQIVLEGSRPDMPDQI